MPVHPAQGKLYSIAREQKFGTGSGGWRDNGIAGIVLDGTIGQGLLEHGLAGFADVVFR